MKFRKTVSAPVVMSLAFCVGMTAACSTPADAQGSEAGPALQGQKYKLANSAKVGEKRAYIDLEGAFEAVNPTPAEVDAHIAKHNKAIAAGAEYYLEASVPDSRVQPALKKVTESFLTPVEGSETTLTCKAVENGVAMWPVPAIVWVEDNTQKTVDATLKIDARGVVGTEEELGVLNEPLWGFLLFTRQFPAGEVAIGQTWKDKTYLRVEFEEFECKLEEVGKFAGRDAFRVSFRNIPGKTTYEFYTGYAWYAMDNGQLLEGSVVRKTVQVFDDGAVHVSKFGIRAK